MLLWSRDKSRVNSWTRSPDRSCMMLHDEIFNYCPTLHALNQAKKKRQRFAHCFRRNFLSGDLTRVANCRRKFSQKCPVNDCSCDNPLATEKTRFVTSMKILIFAVKFRPNLNLIGKWRMTLKEDQIAARGTKVAFPAFWESSLEFNHPVLALKTQTITRINIAHASGLNRRPLNWSTFISRVRWQELMIAICPNIHGLLWLAKHVVYGEWKWPTWEII